MITPQLNIPTQATGLADDDAELLARLIRQWHRKRPRNLLRHAYRDMHHHVAWLGASIPEYMRNQLEVVCSWPDKAVTALAARCMFDGFTVPSGDADPYAITDTLAANRFDLLVPETLDAALTYSCSFVVTLPGNTGAGEPPVVITGADALWATALWDGRRRALTATLVLDSLDDDSRPMGALLLTPTHVTRLARADHGWVAMIRQDHNLGRVPVEPISYRASLNRPFGRSRISRAVMALTDRVVRAGFRTEVSSDLYAAPALLLLGADESMFTGASGQMTPLWTWYMGRLKALPKDEDGDIPKLETISQQSMQPFIDLKRALAAEFSAETSVPISSLGIVQDNPSSAEAIYAAKEDLVIEATAMDRAAGYNLARVAQNVACLQAGVSPADLDEDMRHVSARWRNPAMPSVVSQSDAMVKQIQAVPALAATDVALEEMGYSAEQITRIRSQVRRATTDGVLERLLPNAGRTGQETGSEEA